MIGPGEAFWNHQDDLFREPGAFIAQGLKIDGFPAEQLRPPQKKVKHTAPQGLSEKPSGNIVAWLFSFTWCIDDV